MNLKARAKVATMSHSLTSTNVYDLDGVSAIDCMPHYSEIVNHSRAVESRRIRLLNCLPVFGVGGTERQVVNLVKELDRERFDVRFACMRRWGDLMKEIEQLNMPIAEYPISHLYDWNAFSKEFQFSRNLSRQRVQIMHSYNFYANVFAIPAARLARIPVVVASVRDLGVYMTPLQCRVNRMICRLADRVIVNAEAIRDWLAGQGLPTSKISVIHNGVDLDQFRNGNGPAIRKELGIPENAPLVVMLARFDVKKGQALFLEAAPRILRRCPGTHFLLVGEAYTRNHDDEIRPDDAYRERLERGAQMLGIGANVHLPGMRDDVADILAAASVSILPSYSEGISNTLLESMAAGVPVVATRVGGTPEIIHRDGEGILIPPGDAEALAEAVSSIIENPLLAARLSFRGRKRVEDSFSLGVMVRETQNLYLQLLKSKGVLC